jgi:excisionase family DNA binding protein
MMLLDAMIDKQKNLQGELLTARQAADVLGISTNTLLVHIRTGKLEASRFGHFYLVQRKHLAWFAKTRRKPGRPRKTLLAKNR